MPVVENYNGKEGVSKEISEIIFLGEKRNKNLLFTPLERKPCFLDPLEIKSLTGLGGVKILL
jgi:hypothetical protein